VAVATRFNPGKLKQTKEALRPITPTRFLYQQATTIGVAADWFQRKNSPDSALFLAIQ